MIDPLSAPAGGGGAPEEVTSAFQAYGAVLLLSPGSLQVVNASEHADRVLGLPAGGILQASLADVFVAEDAAMLARELVADAHVLGWRRVQLRDGQGAKVHGFEPGQGLLGLDVIPQAPAEQTSGAQAVERVAQWSEQLLSTTSVDELFDLAMRTVRSVTGFEGAWTVELQPDGHGLVVGADAPQTDDTVGQRVLGSDIPPGFPRVRGRVGPFFVADLEQAPVGLVGPCTAQLDFDGSALRRPYPEFLQRLADIGVRATLAVPVVIDGATAYQLIAHHPRPMVVSPASLAELRLLGTAASTHLAELLELDRTRERLERATWSARVLRSMAGVGDLFEGIVADREALLGLCGATSAFISIDGRTELVGDPVPERWLRDVVATAAKELDGALAPIAGSNEQPAPSISSAPEGCNFVAARLGADSASMVIWMRPLAPVRQVAWIDHEPVEAAPSDGLFGGMQTLVREQRSVSLAWSDVEMQAVNDFHGALANLVMARYQQLASLNAQLARSNHEFDAFAHAAAHDLRQPIRGIHQYTEFFLEDVADKLEDDERAQLETVLTLTGRMSGLLDDLMQYAELGEAPWRAEGEVDLGAAVAEVVELLPPSTLADVTVAVEDGSMRIDAVALRHLLLNLVGNAIKYGGDQPHVSIGITTLGEAAKVSDVPEAVMDLSTTSPVLFVADRGVGIAAEHQSRVFELFKKVDGKSDGTGAGLAICRRIARRHGGEIWLRSQAGEGTTFYVVVA
ncbi:MAG: ATP-binding protein [Patulibacter minatonensis]